MLVVCRTRRVGKAYAMGNGKLVYPLPDLNGWASLEVHLRFCKPLPSATTEGMLEATAALGSVATSCSPNIHPPGHDLAHPSTFIIVQQPAGLLESHLLIHPYKPLFSLLAACIAIQPD